MRPFTFVVLMVALVAPLAAELKVAVVDEQVIIDQYEKSAFLVKKLEEEFRMKEQELKTIESRLEQGDKMLRTAGPAQRDKLMDDLSRARIELEVGRKILQEVLTSKRARYTMTVVEDIQKAIETVGKEEGYDLILRKAIPNARGNDTQRTVFFHSDKMDITQRVLKYLNMKYRQETP